jgi:hypothetical protein
LPEASVYVGNRRISRDSDIYTVRADWAVSPRWQIGLVQQQDRRDGEGLNTEVAFRRISHDFVFEVSFLDDRTTDDRRVSVAIIPLPIWSPPTSLERVGQLDYEAQRWYR